MATGANRPEQSEIVHVLFMDLVGFGRLPMDAQSRLLTDLQSLLRNTPEFQRAEVSGDLLCLPTGDGMALVFFRDAAAPVQCAREMARTLREAEHIRLRMGIHSGPVSRVHDINGNENVAGAGINMAQRVMDCCDAGHILLSGTAADLVRQLGAWESDLHDLGECTVKHGLRLRLFNLYGGDIGNPDRPAQLSMPVHSAAKRIALLYRQNAQPDTYLAQVLETQLSARGHRVFVDRLHFRGVEWAAEMERAVREADVIAPLISDVSIDSDLLEYEIQQASEAAQRQQGRPQILPIRLKYARAYPDPLANILDPLPAIRWDSPSDDRLVVEALARAVRQIPGVPSFDTQATLEPVGGAVPLDSRFYIVRPTDVLFEDALARRDSVVLLKGARQMGKTSLLARGLQQARASGAHVVRTDLQKLNIAQLESAETLYLALTRSIADQLSLDVLPSDTWDARYGANENLERYLRRVVLRDASSPLVWGLDEVDRLFTCAFGSEVFGLFRSWHNERSLDPSGPWQHLTLAIAFATEAHLFITDVNQSPFNVGTKLVLDDFTIEQVSELNGRYGAPLGTIDDVARFFRLVGGNPYLVRRGLHEMVVSGIDLAGLEEDADRDDGPFSDHLRRILVLLAQDPALCDVVRAVMEGAGVPDLESFYRLRSAGILAGDSLREARPRCLLYRSYLQRHLL